MKIFFPFGGTKAEIVNATETLQVCVFPSIGSVWAVQQASLTMYGGGAVHVTVSGETTGYIIRYFKLS